MTINDDCTIAQTQCTLAPYTMQVKHAARHFGFGRQSLYNMVSTGKLVFGTHYLKVGNKVLIMVLPFKKWMHERSGLAYGGDQDK